MGHTAIGGAAYRAGQNLRAFGQHEDGGDKPYYYSNRRNVVRDAFIMTPTGDMPECLALPDGPSHKADREQRQALWNDVEVKETAKNARLGREVQLGFAYELSHADQRALVEDFVKRYVTEGGERETSYQVKTQDGKRIETQRVEMRFVADVAIHNYGKRLPAMGGSEEQRDKIKSWIEAEVPFVSAEEAQGMEDVHVRENRNRRGDVTSYQLYQPHAHVRITPRTVVDGEWADDKFASRVLNEHSSAMHWRYDWAKLQNDYLERAGHDVRVTCHSELEQQFPELAFKGRKDNAQTRELEQREDQLSEEQRKGLDEAREVQEIDEEFRKVNNEAIVDAYREIEDREGSQTEEGERTRLALWWHQTAARFNQWRFEFGEKADEWRERFEQHKQRIRSVIGWHDVERENPDMYVSDASEESQVQELGGQEPER